MKKIAHLFLLAMLLCGSSVIAQTNEKKVSKIETGTVLNNDHIGFLSMVSKEKLAKTRTRGAKKFEVKVAGKTYTAGQTLSKDDAEKLNAAIENFRKDNPGEKKPGGDVKKTRGSSNDWCYYWYYYCYGNGYCAWYKQWYWCY